MTNNVWVLPRNDLAAALDFYRRAKANGTLGDDVIRVLAKLQDDPRALFQAIKYLT